MQKEGIRGVIDPDQFKLFAAQRAALDLAAVVIGNQAAFNHAACNSFAFKLVAETAEIDGHQIRWAHMQGHVEGALTFPGASQLRFKIPGYEPVSAVPARYFRGREPAFEKAAGGAIVPGGQRAGPSTDALPDCGAAEALSGYPPESFDAAFFHWRAGLEQCRDCRGMPIRCPSRQRRERNVTERRRIGGFFRWPLRTG